MPVVEVAVVPGLSYILIEDAAIPAATVHLVLGAEHGSCATVHAAVGEAAIEAAAVHISSWSP